MMGISRYRKSAMLLCCYLNGENTKFSWFPRAARELYIFRVSSSMDPFNASPASRFSSAEEHFMMRSERNESWRRTMLFGMVNHQTDCGLHPGEREPGRKETGYV